MMKDNKKRLYYMSQREEIVLAKIKLQQDTKKKKHCMLRKMTN